MQAVVINKPYVLKKGARLAFGAGLLDDDRSKQNMEPTLILSTDASLARDSVICCIFTLNTGLGW